MDNNIKDVSQSTNIYEIADAIQTLNPNAVIRIGNPVYDSQAYERIYSSVPVEKLVLPSGFYFNEKNGITNKHNTQTGFYCAFDVEDLTQALPNTLLTRKLQSEVRLEDETKFGNKKSTVKDEEGKSCRLSPETWKVVISFYTRQNERLEKEIADVTRQMEDPQGLKEKVKNFFGINRRLKEKLEEKISFNNDRIGNIYASFLGKELETVPEALDENKPLRVPENGVRQAEGLSEGMLQEMNKEAQAVYGAEESKEEKISEDVAAKLDEIRNRFAEEPKKSEVVPETTYEEDKENEEVAALAKKMEEAQKAQAEEKKLNDIERDPEFTELKSSIESALQEENKEDFASPMIIPNNIFEPMKSNEPEEENAVEETPDTSSYEQASEEEPKVEMDKEDILRRIAQNDEDIAARKANKWMNATDHNVIDHMEARNRELKRQLSELEEKPAVDVSSMSGTIDDVEEMIRVCQQLNEEKAKNADTLSHLDEKVKESEDRVAKKLEEYNNISKELREYIAAEQEVKNRQVEDIRNCEEKLNENSHTSETLDAKIEAIKGVMKK